MRDVFDHVDGRHDTDPDSLDVPSLDRARYKAIASAADTLADAPYALWDRGKVRI